MASTQSCSVDGLDRGHVRRRSHLPAGPPLEVPLEEDEPEPDDDDPDELELRPRRIGGVFACDDDRPMHFSRPVARSWLIATTIQLTGCSSRRWCL